MLYLPQNKLHYIGFEIRNTDYVFNRNKYLKKSTCLLYNSLIPLLDLINLVLLSVFMSLVILLRTTINRLCTFQNFPLLIIVA